MTMMETALPKPAATLVLLRPDPDGFSVLLMKRPSRSSFMGGMHVFPGGKVEAGDWGGPMSARDASVAERMGLAPEAAAAYVQAACRETFEEMGVLLGKAGLSADDVRGARAAMAEEKLAWHQWAGAVPEPGWSPVYFDHWITPEIEPKRFDTRFFATEIPAGAEPEPNSEAIAWGFYRPDKALELVERGEMSLAPPTLVTLIRLAKHATSGEALRELGARRVGPLQPALAGADPLTLALPGHPAHPVPERLGDNPHTIIMRDGRWEIIW